MCPLAGRTTSEPASSGTQAERAFPLPLALQLGVVLFEELANLVTEVEQSLPLFDVQRHRHALQAVHADRPFLADFAIEGAAFGLLDVGQQLRSFVDGQLAGSQFFENLVLVQRALLHDGNSNVGSLRGA